MGAVRQRSAILNVRSPRKVRISDSDNRSTSWNSKVLGNKHRYVVQVRS